MSSRTRAEGLLTACLFGLAALFRSTVLLLWLFGALALLSAGWLVWDVIRTRRRACRAQVIQNLSVDILLRPWSGASVVVRDPMGNEHRSPPGWPESWIGVDVNASYPDDFPTAPKLLQSGIYQVSLRTRSRIRRPREVVHGSCSFTIPEGEPGWFVRWEGINVENEDQVTIYVQGGGGARPLKRLQCDLWSPGQVEADTPARAKFAGDQSANLIPQATYPKDFEGAAPLRKGVYRGEWSAWAQAAPVGAEGRRSLVRRFAFDWPGLEEAQAGK